MDSRLLELARVASRRCRLDLTDRVVLTEAATGAYLATPLIAAMAGAKHVYALARSSSYGTIDDVRNQTGELARHAGIERRISVIDGKNSQAGMSGSMAVSEADIITNSGNVRPIDSAMIAAMKPSAVISLMYEAWEFRPQDVDLSAARKKGIPVAGANERHPEIDVFSDLGAVAAKLFEEAGRPIEASNILLLCDNPFADYLVDGLQVRGAHVTVFPTINAAAGTGPYEAIIVSLSPRSELVVSAADARAIARQWPAAFIGQFWGDIDREAFFAAGLEVWPRSSPLPGHMGNWSNDASPETVIKFITGGFKAGEILSQTRLHGATCDDALEYLKKSGYGTLLEEGRV